MDEFVSFLTGLSFAFHCIVMEHFQKTFRKQISFLLRKNKEKRTRLVWSLRCQSVARLKWVLCLHSRDWEEPLMQEARDRTLINSNSQTLLKFSRNYWTNRNNSFLAKDCVKAFWILVWCSIESKNHRHLHACPHNVLQNGKPSIELFCVTQFGSPHLFSFLLFWHYHIIFLNTVQNINGTTSCPLDTWSIANLSSFYQTCKWSSRILQISFGSWFEVSL